MKKVAIVGLGWLGMPLAMSLAAKGWQVTGSKNHGGWGRSSAHVRY
jgi:UDP-N-acetyl-D-mannosaminuronate dehydrogenase